MKAWENKMKTTRKSLNYKSNKQNREKKWKYWRYEIRTNKKGESHSGYA